MTQTSDSDEANEIEVLHPDRELVIGGEKIEVREFRFLEGLDAEVIAQPLLNGLADLLGGESRRTFGYSAMAKLFAQHKDEFVQLVGMATGKPPEWFGSLGDADGQRLAMTFWTVNRGFFTRRVVAEVATRKALERAAAEATPLAESDSARSTPN